jgi:hypothetical protein
VVSKVVLSNLVLASISIFYLSFFKTPMTNWKTLVGIQRREGGLWSKTFKKYEHVTFEKVEAVAVGGANIISLEGSDISKIWGWNTS